MPPSPAPTLTSASLPWDQRQRFKLLEAQVIWRGQVRTADLRDAFDISTGKAERDFAAYTRLAPANLVRDRETGEYRAADRFVPQFLRGTASEYLQVLRNHELGDDLPLAMGSLGPPATEVLDAPAREFDVRVLSRLNSAIRERRYLAIEYQSMTHPEPRRLEIAPHVLVFAGRWHARAWSAAHRRPAGTARALRARPCARLGLAPARRNPHRTASGAQCCAAQGGGTGLRHAAWHA